MIAIVDYGSGNVAAIADIRISGAVPTMLSLLWCSETQ